MFSAIEDVFRRVAHRAAGIVGSVWAFAAAVLLVAVWLITGPIFGFSDSWQLVINTGTTIVTFLMVFLIQNTQNREARIVQLKLDELLRAIEKARTSLVDLDELSDSELMRLEKEFHRLGHSAGRGRAAPEGAEDAGHAAASTGPKSSRGG